MVTMNWGERFLLSIHWLNLPFFSTQISFLFFWKRLLLTILFNLIINNLIFNKIHQAKESEDIMLRNTEFGTLLTTARLSAGYSQREVAEFTCISRSAYGHMELCIRKPTAEFILRISALYQTNPVIFLQTLIPEDLYMPDRSFLHYLSGLSKYDPNSSYAKTLKQPKLTSRRKKKRNPAHKSKS